MYCSKCGAEVNTGSFCPKCGNKMQETSSSDVEEKVKVSEGEVELKNANITKPVAIAKKIDKKIIAGIICAVALLLLFIIIGVNHKIVIKLDNYLKVDFEGYDTLGTASYSIDWDSFEKDYGKKIKANKKALNRMIKEMLSEEIGFSVSDEYFSEVMSEINSYSEVGALVLFLDGSGSLDKKSGLSNGDQVKFTWDIEDEESLCKVFNCKFKYEESIHEVIGLEHVGSFDPFDGIIISYSGIAPNGTASIENDRINDYDYYLSYDIDKNKGLSNGDKIKVTVKLTNSEERFVSEFGMLPSSNEKEFTVDGLMAYITSSNEIPEKLLKSMQSQSEDIIRSKVANKWDKNASLKDMKYIGNYFLTSKSDSSRENNKCVLVYKLVAEETMETKNEGTIKEDQDLYYYVSFSNLMIEENGEGAVDISKYDTTSNYITITTEHLTTNRYWDIYHKFSYHGFENIESLYNEVVTKNLESFYHEDNVKE